MAEAGRELALSHRAIPKILTPLFKTLLPCSRLYRRQTLPMPFTKCMVDMQNRNLLSAGKLAIVALSPPPSQRMDLAHRDSSGGLFFWPVSASPKKKPAIDADAGFPVFSRPQLSGLDFGG